MLRIINLPKVDLSEIVKNNDSILIACRIPIKASATIFIEDDSLHSIVAAEAVDVKEEKNTYEGLRIRDTSQWILWPVNSMEYRKNWKKTPMQLSVKLRVVSDSGNIWGSEFGTSRKKGVLELPGR
ncbi:hypothetical protein [Paraflavitalea speifideaquila]|uniref:hypothetical protein n=1 Tax=Paraflavitalea speifideaquila TaxID=3076558 RepID=UPI0028E7023F|nr:hypothetical protein [Paraflavitalea speifideiaquila]